MTATAQIETASTELHGAIVPPLTAEHAQTAPTHDPSTVALEGQAHASAEWRDIIYHAAEQFGTPCYVARWAPVAESVARLDRLSDSGMRIRSWLSFKTHPLPPLVRRWVGDGRGVEVVSEVELATAIALGCTADNILVNGVAKHVWLRGRSLPFLRVHFDSEREVGELLPLAVADQWRVGVRCHAPDECDARDPRFGGQFGMSASEAVRALRLLRRAGADVQSVHFHLGQRAQAPDAYANGVRHLARICQEAAFEPRFVDLGGGLPSVRDAEACLDGLAAAVAAARDCFSSALEEVWLENGRFVTEASTALAVRVLDVKERRDCRYLICDGGRTNHALAADKGPHDLLVVPERAGSSTLTTVCGPTCMTDDILGRVPLPRDIRPGDVIAWMDAGAYHLPWETRFSQPLCAVAWSDGPGHIALARGRERAETWAAPWII